MSTGVMWNVVIQVIHLVATKGGGAICAHGIKRGVVDGMDVGLGTWCKL